MRLSSAFATLKRWTLTTAAIVISTVVLLVIVNFICLGIYTMFPGTLQTNAEKVTADFYIKFTARQSGHAAEWLAIDEPATLQEFFVENTAHSTIGNVYEDYTGFKTTPWKGKFFNFKPAGYRESKGESPWPPLPSNYNVFFFGGSTTMGIGPDWATISSYFQDRFAGKPIEGKPVKVYNFGRGAYFSTQERILFQQLLLDQRKPDIAIFVDGLNDFYFLDGKPGTAAMYEQIFERAQAAQAGVALQISPTPQTKPLMQRISDSLLYRAKALAERTSSFPITRMATAIAETIMPSAQVELPIYKPEITPPDVLEKVIDRYLGNKRQIEGIAAAYGFKTLFVWQPVPGYKYDLKYHISLNPVYGLGGHERSSQGYPLMAARLKSANLGKDFLWLADMQENLREPLYMDAVHYTAAFSKTLGNAIADHVSADTSPALNPERLGD